MVRALSETFPLLSRVQRDYGDAIRVVALTDDRPEVARRFFHDHVEQMRFAVGVTGSETVQSLMFGGFGGRGLPSVYVIDDGSLLWGGSPDTLEHTLAGLVSRPSTTSAGSWQTSAPRQATD